MDEYSKMWRYRGQRRPDFAIEPGPGRESVWDYPRPPALVPDGRLVEVRARDQLVASSAGTCRVLETASPPAFYIPPEDVNRQLLVPAPGRSVCEWKGAAVYWDILSSPEKGPAGWSYTAPNTGFEKIRDYFSFYPSRVDCFVAGERVRPQPGGFYGGWITAEITGPFKGEPGTEGW